MADWHHQQMMAFDTETTGTDVENDRIASVTLCLIEEACEPIYWSKLIKLDVPMPPEAQAVHGLSNAHLDEFGEPAFQVLSATAAKLAHCRRERIPVVGMNLAYDFTILDRELRRTPPGHGLELHIGGEPRPVVDVRILDKYVSRRKGKRTLTDMCQHWGVRLDGAHNDRFDAIAAARIAWKIMQQANRAGASGAYSNAELNRYAELAVMDLDLLHDWQKIKYRAQCNSLRAYFNSQHIEHDGVDPSWPLRPYGRMERR